MSYKNLPPLRPLLIIGTRPEAIKMAPIAHACHSRAPEVEPLVCLTAQHREMLDQVIDYFEIGVDYDLNLMAPDQSLSELTCRCLRGVEKVIVESQPDCVVVQGDTTTAMTAALAAFYQRIPAVHVEAGLRTGDLSAPWPEEFNRRAISVGASLHCAPTRQAASRLLDENVPRETVHITGNTVVDALLSTLQRERQSDARWRARYEFLGDQPMILVTAHRRENHGEGLDNICLAISRIAERHGDVDFVFPVHLNPNVQRQVTAALGHIPNVHLIDPVPYPEFVWLLDRCRFVLSDSGGVQEEAPTLRKPVLCLRETTERGEALEAGALKLVGTCVETIVASASQLLSDQQAYRAMQVKENPYGDGLASMRIVDLMLEHIPRRIRSSVDAFKEIPKQVFGGISNGESVGDHSQHPADGATH